ncbi:MAG TPA: BON domain-containing protein [Polyangiaceae bacterium]
MKRVWSVLVLTSTAACAGAAVTPPKSYESPVALRGASTGYPAGVVPDDRIAAVARRELGEDPATRSEAIGVAADHGVLVVTGSVTTLLAARRALDIAHLVRGVRAIVDRVDLAAVPRPDNDVKLAIESALERDPLAARQRVLTRVQGGAVLLRGEVDSPALENAVLADIQSVPGVVAVVDDLVVSHVTAPDALLAATVRRSLADDPWLDGSRVEVDARDGVVRLGGWVAGPRERERAEADAQAAAPAAVDARGIRVDAFADDGTLRGSPEMARSDGDLEQSLLDAFLHDGRITPPFAPKVDVRNGVVVLSGAAPNPDTARAVVGDARSLPGVRGVLDLVTAPGEVPAGVGNMQRR